MEKITSIVILCGSLAFLIAAFLPITIVFVIERDIARLQSRPGEWAVSLLMFGLGSTLTAVGLGLWTLQLRGPNTAVALGYFGFTAIALGAVCWGVILYLRYTLPLEIVFQEPTLGWWFVAYTLLTQAGLIGYGLALLQAGYPRWLGLSTVIPAVLLFIAYFIFKDVPPFAHYLITLMIGIRLLL